MRGLLAHELAHQVSYRRRSLWGRARFLWNYPFSVSGRRRVEREADEITIEKGYGEDLIRTRTLQFEVDDKKHVAGQKKVYLPVKTLREML